MSYSELKTFDGKKPKILVVGSLAMDQIVSTDVFPNEGETVIGKSFNKAPGGKGANQAVQAALLGADVTMVGKVGNDDNGKVLLAACDKFGINTEHISLDQTVPSGCSVIILEGKEGATKNRIIVIPGTNMTISAADITFLETTISQFDLVMLQLEIPMEINEMVAEIAHENNVPVMLNSAPAAPLNDSFLQHLTYISPNEHELEKLTGLSVHDTSGEINMDLVERATRLLYKKGIETVIVTLGGNGAVLMKNEMFIHSPCVANTVVVDPTAAGDSFVGAFCYAVCLTDEIKEILTFANYTASLTVSRMGAMPSLPTLDEVEHHLEKDNIKLSWI